MISFSHDPEAATLYCYFTELEEGQATGEQSAPACLMLDRAGQISGIQIDIADLDTTLSTALLDEPAPDLPDQHPLEWNWQDDTHLTIIIRSAEQATTLVLEDPAILDLDAADQILGTEIFLPDQLNTPTALAHLDPWMIALEDEQITIHAHPQPDHQAEPAETVAHVGMVALVGKPNVGKSTLLNALLGQKIAIVSPRPQTTRVPMRGILNHHDAQIVFIDTPGIHKPRHELGHFMVKLARRAIPAADLVCFMVDISTPPTQLDKRIADEVQRVRIPRLLLLNKVDLRTRGGTHLEAYRDLAAWDMEVAISARNGDGLSTLLDEIVQRLPPGERLYPVDIIADQSERHLASELVREKVLYFTEHEVPHSVAVEVEEWEEKQGAAYIRMTINVERESQKGIIIGAGGAMLKRIGSAARSEIEQMLGHQVYLDLWVKTHANWRNDLSSLGWLGYRLKDWE